MKQLKRFLIDSPCYVGERIELTEKESHHISRVLRLKKGSMLELCDQSGNTYAGVIDSEGKRVSVIIEQKMAKKNPSGCELIVCQGAIKTKKLELILQKCTELGVHTIIPFQGARSQGNTVSSYTKKDQRWRKIIDEARKQCLRPDPLKLLQLATFNDMLSMAADYKDMVKILFWEKEESNTMKLLQDTIVQHRKAVLLFGPEGGFTDQEVVTACEAGFVTVSLGKSILRAETAVIAGVSIVRYISGNM